MTLKWCKVVKSGELKLHFAGKGDNALMLIGTYQHNIDAKGRVFIPVKLRGDLGERFIVSKGLDNCLFVHSLKEWEKIEQTITALPIAQRRDVQRFWFSGACEVELDAQAHRDSPESARICFPRWGDHHYWRFHPGGNLECRALERGKRKQIGR